MVYPGKVDITKNEKELIQKYKDFSKRQLKQNKDRSATPESFRYVSKLLGS